MQKVIPGQQDQRLNMSDAIRLMVAAVIRAIAQWRSSPVRFSVLGSTHGREAAYPKKYAIGQIAVQGALEADRLLLSALIAWEARRIVLALRPDWPIMVC